MLTIVVPLALLAGCGGSDPATPLTSVRLSVAEPGDAELVRDDRVAVSLDPGTNVVDVLASAADRRPAMTAVRVRRQVTVTVPDLAGETPEGAADRLTALGLEVKQERHGGVFDLLLPGEPSVCETSRPSGPRTESYLSRYAIVSASPRSFAATTSKSPPRCKCARNRLRPMRPNPLIPTRTATEPPRRYRLRV